MTKSKLKKKLLKEYYKEFPNPTQEMLEDLELKIDMVEDYKSDFPNHTEKDLERLLDSIDRMIDVKRIIKEHKLKHVHKGVYYHPIEKNLKTFGPYDFENYCEDISEMTDNDWNIVNSWMWKNCSKFRSEVNYNPSWEVRQ